jgi:hypothetical protein
MPVATLGIPATVSEELVSEINSITTDTDTGTTTQYQPDAWTREGRTD